MKPVANSRLVSWCRLSGAICMGIPALAFAGATTDGSVGPVRTLSGHFTVPQSLGTLAGSNLFHSFSQFNVDPNESATFTTSSPSIRNVISRVTGGQQSTIQGLLKLDAAAGSQPDFYFVNPAGVVFSAGAQIDVPAGFHVSTAQKLQFADGFVWDTTKSTSSSLTVADPSAFGFVGGSTAAAIRFNHLHPSDAPPNDPDVVFSPGSAVNVVGGSVEFDSTNLFLPEGNLHLIATGSKALDVLMRGDTRIPLDGPIVVTNTGIVTTETGSILLEGGNTTLSAESAIVSDNAGSFAAGPIKIVADGVVFKSGSVVVSRAFGSGSASDVSIHAHTLLVDGGGGVSGVQTSGFSEGRTGNIEVDVLDDLKLQAGGQVGAVAQGTGAVGNIVFRARSIAIDNQRLPASFTGVSSEQFQGDPDVARGSIRIQVADDLRVQNGGQVLATTSSPASAGQIVIEANFVAIVGGSIASSSFAARAGNAGTIRIAAKDTITLKDGRISTSSVGTGSAGTVQLTAGTIVIDGAFSEVSSDAGTLGTGGNVSIGVAGDLLIYRGGKVTTRTSGLGAAGSISIDTGSLFAEGADDTGIFGEATLRSGGQTGSITILAREGITISENATVSIANHAILTDPISLRPTTLSVTTPRLVLTRGGIISADTVGNVGASKLLFSSFSSDRPLLVIGDGTGAITSSTRMPTQAELDEEFLDGPSPGHGTGVGGNIELRAESIQLSGVVIASRASAGTRGAAGRVDIGVQDGLAIQNGARVTTDSSGIGNAGSIAITAGSMLIDRSAISSGTQSGSSGTGGSVDVAVSNQMSITNGGSIDTSTLGAGAGGSVNIRATGVRVAGAASSVRATAGASSSGKAGDINVTARESVTLSDGASLSIQNDAQASALSFASSSLAAQARQTTLSNTLSITAPAIIADGAGITASSTGNIGAGSLALNASEGRITLRNASLATSAHEGDGGDIDLAAGRMVLDHSQVTTSVEGKDNGNGGNIRFQGKTLLMNTGFVQANTTAPHASGGDIDLGVGLLVTSGALLLGGHEPLLFDPNLLGVNVIQAASPNGIAGNVRVSGPIIDPAGNLTQLSSAPTENVALPRDLCQNSATSTFTPIGQGGVRPRTTTWLRADNLKLAPPSTITAVSKVSCPRDAVRTAP